MTKQENGGHTQQLKKLKAATMGHGKEQWQTTYDAIQSKTYGTQIHIYRQNKTTDKWRDPTGVS